MTKKGYFKDARLLEALEYIDQDLVGEVAVKLKFVEAPVLTEESVMTWRTPFKHWKRMLAAVACLLLLSAAIPVANYVLPRVGINIGGNAGAGTSELEVPTPTENEFLETEPEMTQTLETGTTTTEAEILNSGFDKYLEAFADMSADEIYAEVLKGGWVVVQDPECENITAVELWQEFLKDVEQGKKSSFLIACYSEYITIKPVGADDKQYEGISQIVLAEVKFDGKAFVKTTKWYHPDFKWYYTYESSYLLKEKSTFTDKTTYYLANHLDEHLNDPRYSSEKIDIDMERTILFDQGLITVSETTAGMQYEYTPSIGSLEQISEVGVTVGNVTVEAQKHISAVYNCTGKNEASGEFIYSTMGEGIIFFEKGIPDGCPILRAEGSAKITVLTENLGFRMYLYDMSGKNDVRGVEGTTIYLPTAPGLYYLNIFVDVDHPLINDEIVPVIGNQYVAQYRYLAAIVVE